MTKEIFEKMKNEYAASSKKAYFKMKGRGKKVMLLVEAFEKSLKRSRMKEYNYLAPEEKLIRQKLVSLAQTLPSSGYSMGEEKHLSLKECKKYSVTIDCRQYYSNRCKYSETHGWVSVTLSPRDVMGVKVIGGIPTRILRKHSQDICKCEWIEWSTETYRGKVTSVTPKWKKGFLVGDYHAESLEEARRQVQRMKESKRLLSEEIRTNAKIEKLTLKKAEKMKISVDDSIASGNCRPGTTEFIVRYDLLERDFISGKELIEISRWAKGYYNYFIARIFAYKVIGRSPYDNEVKKVKEILFN